MREIEINWAFYTDEMSISYDVYNDIELLMNHFSNTNGGITKVGILEFINVVIVIFSNVYARKYANQEQEIREITNQLVNKIYMQNSCFFEEYLKHTFSENYSIGFSQAKNLLSKFMLPRI